MLDSDLYDRISLVTVWIPSLREFREDLPGIWRQVWLEHGRIADVVVDPEHHALLSWFASYGFPGNLRDLISLALWIQVYFLQYQSNDAAIPEAIKRTGCSLCMAKPETDKKDQLRDAGLPLKERIRLFRKRIVTESVSLNGSFSSAARVLQVDEKTIRNIMASDIYSDPCPVSRFPRSATILSTWPNPRSLNSSMAMQASDIGWIGRPLLFQATISRSSSRRTIRFCMRISSSQR